MNLKYFIGLMCLPFLVQSCKEAPKQPVNVGQETPEPVVKEKYTVYEPLKKSVEKDGEVVFEKDTFAVFREYTDDIAFKLPIGDPNHTPGIMNLRDVLFHVVNKRSNDTITFRKEMFKKYIDPDDYDMMIVQAALFNVPTKKGICPFMINLCQPETDYCYFFDIKLNKNEFTITEVLEEDFPKE